MKTYKTVQGDMWDGIAYTQLGDTKYTDVLIRANAEYHDVYIFPSGVELSIPDVDTYTVADKLPPWKKVNS